MKRILILFVLYLGLSSAALAVCDGCKDAREAHDRPVVHQHGGPQKNLICTYVKMPNPCDGVVVEAQVGNGPPVKVADYGAGAAVNMAMKRPFKLDKKGRQIVACTGYEQAMVCVRRRNIPANTTLVKLTPGNTGTCYEFTGTELSRWFSAGSLPPEKAVRLGWGTVGGNTAPPGFKKLP